MSQIMESRPAEPGWVRIINRLSVVAGWFGALGCALLVINILIDVASRAVWGSSVPGTLDLVTYWWMPFVALFPLALAEIRGEHIAVDALNGNLSPRHRKVAIGLVTAVALLFAIVLTYYSYLAAGDSIAKQESALTAQWLPVWPVKVLASAALTIFTLQMFATMRDVLLGSSLSTTERDEQLFDELEADHNAPKRGTEESAK